MRIYFMGICGTAMGNTAIMLKKLGHTVCGADTDVYPPMSNVLIDAGIAIEDGFNPKKLEKLEPDLVVVGNVISRGNPEIEWLLETKRFKFTSLPALLQDFILSDRYNIVISGTHGKTTTSSIIAYLLYKLGSTPGYLIGGVPQDLPTGACEGIKGGPFVIEGDEYDSAFFDKRSKFIHYLPSILIINNLEFDHSDIFRDLFDVKQSFKHLLRIVPANGYVLINGDDSNILSLFPISWARVIKVGVGEGNELRIVGFQESATESRFKLYWRGELWKEVVWNQPGLFNARNVAIGALAVGLTLNPENPTMISLKEVSSFNGVKRRQELLIDNKKIKVLEDFAHHPTAVEEMLKSIRCRYTKHKITVGFEPRSNTAKSDVFQQEFARALIMADEVMIGNIHNEQGFVPKSRLNTTQLAVDLIRGKVSAQAFSSNLDLLESLWNRVLERIDEDHIIIFFTNGSFDGIILKLVKRIKGL